MAVKTPFELPTEGGRYVVDGRSSKPRRVTDEDTGPGAQPPADPVPAPTAPPAAIEPPPADPAPDQKD